MGLFDMFKSDSGDKMSPHLAFATALLYMMSADGEMDNEEIGHLLSVLGGHDDGRGTIGVGAQSQALLDSAVKYRRKHPVETFLQEATPLLTDAQKMCILVNLIDSSLADGQPEREERIDLERYAQTVPLGRPGRPADIVGPLLFLLGPGSIYMTGQTIHPNGGIWS